MVYLSFHHGPGLLSTGALLLASRHFVVFCRLALYRNYKQLLDHTCLPAHTSQNIPSDHHPKQEFPFLDNAYLPCPPPPLPS